MATQDLYEEWKQRMVRQGREEGVQLGREQGREEGVQLGCQKTRTEALFTVYEARFGTVPASLRAALGKVSEDEDAPRWLALVSTRTEEEIAEALLAARRPRPAPRRPSLRRNGAKPHR